MKKIKLAIVTQTPLIHFKSNAYSKKSFIDINNIDADSYSYSVGGVSIMEKDLIEYLADKKIVDLIYWFSLNPNSPKHIKLNELVHLYNISTGSTYLKKYSIFKGLMWENIHGIKKGEYNNDDFVGYANHNWIFSKKILEKAKNFDAYYIHDFQQLMMGHMIGPIKPAILRWHVPFVPEFFSPLFMKFILHSVESFDTVIVSTKRDLEGLIRAGYKGIAHQVYPHINSNAWTEPSESEIINFRKKFGIKKSDFIVTNVARMDSIKSQDSLIKAIAKVVKKAKNVKLMLVGSGSFTNTLNKEGFNKSMNYFQYLKQLVKDLGIEKHVIFTGYLSINELKAAYKATGLFVLPSLIEGFGLVVVEAWQYEKCAIVSNGAGVSELITNGVNGYTYNPQDIKQLADYILMLYSNEGERASCGKHAKKLAKICDISNTGPKVISIIENAIATYKR